MNEIQTSADPAAFGLRARHLCYLDGHAPQSGEIVGLVELNDDMPTDLADSPKVDEEDRKTDHAPLVQVKANWAATVTATIETNLRQGGAVVKEVATETGTAESVILVPDPIVSAPWSVLFGRGEPFCDTCQDTAHDAVSCFSCPMTCQKSTGRATLPMRWTV